MTDEERRAAHAARTKKWADANKDKIRAKKKRYSEANKEHIAAVNKAWRLKNRPALVRGPYKAQDGKSRADVRRERYATDPNYKTRQRIHSDMYKVTRGILKSGKMFALLGCTLDELSAHIEAQFEEGMSFDNLGQWEVDHVKPLHTFDLTDEAQLQTACHYSNTRPLWRQDNRRY